MVINAMSVALTLTTPLWGLPSDPAGDGARRSGWYS